MRALNSTHRRRRLGLGPDRTKSYPLLAIRKPHLQWPEITITGVGWGVLLDVNSGSSGAGVARRKIDVSSAYAPPPASLALLLCRRKWRLPMPPRPPHHGPYHVTGARGHRRRSPPRGHGGALSKRSTSPPYAPPCSPGGALSGNTRAFPRRIRITNVPTEVAVFGDDLRQTKREDAVTSLQSVIKAFVLLHFGHAAIAVGCGVPKVTQT